MSRRKPPEESGGGGSWMDTYGDMVTLLLTFFVLLFSFSTVDAKKWEALVASFGGEGKITVFNGGVTLPLDSPENTTATGNSFNELYDAMSRYIDMEGLKDRVSVDLVNETQILLRLGERVLFDSGRADIKEESIDLLNEMCNLVTQFDSLISEIIVEGHTDTDPIRGGAYRTNRRLSNERALAVVEYVEQHTGIDEKKLSSTGKGENWPIAPNDTPENKARNRRVDIIIYSFTDEDADSGPADGEG